MTSDQADRGPAPAHGAAPQPQGPSRPGPARDHQARRRDPRAQRAPRKRAREEPAPGAPPEGVPGDDPLYAARPRAALPALCVTQITGWGIVYYAFPVLNHAITADTGWPATATTAAFSAAMLVAAVAGIPVGRVLDARGPRGVMTGGSVLAVLSVLAIAAAPNLWAFTAAWLVSGVAMAATFYQPAFAAVTRWWGTRRVRALTAITLTGGLASTVFAPLTAVLARHLTWRETYLVLAVVLAVITVPAHALALRGPWPPPAAEGPGAAEDGAAAARAVMRSRPFVLLAAALPLSGVVMYAVVVAQVPLLIERGASETTAAWVLGLGGAGQTLGRTLYAGLARRTGVRARTALLMAAGGVTTVALGLVPGPVALLTVLAVLAGMTRGNLTLLQATAVTERWGAAHYGRLSGVLMVPSTVAAALAPYVGAALAGPLGGYGNVFVALAIPAALSVLLALGTGVPRSASPRARPGARRVIPR